jgi:hypothetical protein
MTAAAFTPALAAPRPFTLPGFALPGALRRLLGPAAARPARSHAAEAAAGGRDPLTAARMAWMDGASLRDLFGETVFELSDSVGVGGANRPGDVFRLQALLHREGDLDAFATGGPTGTWDAASDAALRAFQRANGLAADGLAASAGAVMQALRGFYLPEIG